MKRGIPIKNYVIAFLIAIITIISVLLLSNYYSNYQEYKDRNHIMLFLSEIKEEEIDNFLTENHDIMIYIISSNSHEESIETKVKDIINTNDFSKDMVVLDIKEDNQIIANLKNKYVTSNLQNVEIKENSILFVKSGEIVHILNINQSNMESLKNDIETNFYGEL